MHQLFTYNIELTLCYPETCISYLVVLKISQMFTWVITKTLKMAATLIAYLWALQYLKGRKSNFLWWWGVNTMLYVNNWSGREVGMAQFECKLSSNTLQDFPNHFMSLCSEIRKRLQSKFSAFWQVSLRLQWYINQVAWWSATCAVIINATLIVTDVYKVTAVPNYFLFIFQINTPNIWIFTYLYSITVYADIK